MDIPSIRLQPDSYDSSTRSILALTWSVVNRCISLTAFEAESGCSSGAEDLLM